MRSTAWWKNTGARVWRTGLVGRHERGPVRKGRVAAPAHLVVHHQQHLDQARHARRRLGVADVVLDRPQHHAAAAVVVWS